MISTRRLALAAVIIAVISPTVQAGTVLSFENITHNDADNEQIGEDQLELHVSDGSGGSDADSSSISFKFYNIGPSSSVITGLFFEDETPYLGTASITDSDGDLLGVDFFQDKKDGTLPGGNGKLISFNTTMSFSPENEPPHKGVNQGADYDSAEWVAVTFNLGTYTYGDILAALLSNPAKLRVGVHIQAFPDGGSESFMAPPSDGSFGPRPVPEPGTLALLAMGSAIGFGSFRLRRKYGFRLT